MVPATTSAVLCPFVEERTAGGALVYSDEAYTYTKVLRPYQAIAHARGEYARGDVSTNGIESFWALLKRGYRGTYHSWSPKHLDRYVREFSGHHNARPLDLLDRMGAMTGGLDGRRLRYVEGLLASVSKPDPGFDLVLVSEWNRLARNRVMCAATLEALEASGIRVVATIGNDLDKSGLEVLLALASKSDPGLDTVLVYLQHRLARDWVV